MIAALTTPTATPYRLILPHGAPEDAWRDARRAGVTASEIAVLLGISPYDSPFNLYWKKLGEISEDYDNDAMSLGRHLEPWIADRWAEAHPEYDVAPAGLYASTERPWQMATPDRLLLDDVCRCGATGDVLCSCLPDEKPVAPLEIKSSGTYDGWGEGGTDEIPVHYRAQVLWQMDVLDLTEAHVTCLFLATRQRRDYVVAYDATDVAVMRKAAAGFLARIEHRDPPTVDGHHATTAALKALHPVLDEDTPAIVDDGLAAEYRAACQDAAAAKGRKGLAENRLRAAMGAAKCACDPAGDKVATRSIYTVPEHTRRASEVDKLIPARPKKEDS